MKKNYFILFLFIISIQVSKAQLTLTKAINEPVVGDVFNMVDYDSTTAIPKATGAGMSWNFTSLNAQTFTETITYTTVASSPSASAFPNASIAARRGTSNYEYYRTSTGMMEYDGSQDPSSNEIVTFSNRATWILWPSSFGTNTSDLFAATQVTGTTTASWNGNISYTITGSGTVTLPNGNVHTNCLQLTRNISLSITSGTNSTLLSMIHYEYWSSSCKSPILTVEYQTITSGTNTSKNNSIYVNNTALSVGMNEESIKNKEVLIYPNPAANIFNISLPNNEIPSSIEVKDLSGRTVLTVFNSNSVDASELSEAIYTLKITSKEAVLQKKLMITK